MSVLNRKVMLVYRAHLFPVGHQGVCECGHEFADEERFMGYPTGEGDHWLICLTCHFWNVHKARS